MRFPVALVVASLFVTVAAPMVVGFHNPPLPELASDSFAGTGWASYRFTVSQGAQVSIEAQAVVQQSPTNGGGVFLLNSAGQLQAGFMFASYGGSQEVHVELLDPIGIVTSQRITASNGLTGLALGMSNVPAGTYVAVAMTAATDATSGATRLHASSGSTLDGRTSGTATFMNSDSDFHGAANVLVGAGGLARAQAIVASSASETVSGILFGWFGNSLQPARLSWDGPNGHAVGAGFYYGTAAGDYTFNVEATVGAAITGVWAFGADVTLA